MISNFHKRIFEIVEPALEKKSASKIFDLTIIFLIVINVIAVILESHKELSSFQRSNVPVWP